MVRKNVGTENPTLPLRNAPCDWNDKSGWLTGFPLANVTIAGVMVQVIPVGAVQVIATGALKPPDPVSVRVWVELTEG